MSYSIQHLKETAEIVAKINADDCEKCVKELVGVRTRGGRLFILGVGGSRPALESFVSFRGREPDLDALLRHNGMVETA